jgi:hypothetical protein
VESELGQGSKFEFTARFGVELETPSKVFQSRERVAR